MASENSSMVTNDPEHAAVPRLWAKAHAVQRDVLMHTAFVNTYAVATGAGLLLVDPGLRANSAVVHEQVRAWSDAPLHTALYTHGHVDHAFGLAAWLEAGERPQIIAQENCVARFKRYQLTSGLQGRVNQRQFSLPKPAFPHRFDWPTVTVRDSLTQQIGDIEVHYHAAKGETDDALYAWIPERGYLFTGDLIIWSAPNCGNPQKVQRYPLEWVEALEQMAGLDAEWAARGHPEHTGAQELKRDVYRARVEAAEETMTQGIYRAAMNDAIMALGGERETPNRRLALQ